MDTENTSNHSNNLSSPAAYNNYDEVLVYNNSEREYRMYENYFRKNYLPYLPQNKKAKILDMGCANGIFLRFLKNLNYENIYGIDLSPENLEIAKKHGLNVIFADLFEYLKTTDGNYDLIVLNDVIEHIPREKIIPMLQLVLDKLKPGGKFLIKTMNMNNSISPCALFCDFTHFWGYTEKSIKQVLRQAGYKKMEVIELIVYPGVPLIDSIIWFIYKIIHLLYKIKYTFYGKPDLKVFTKNFLAIAYK